MSEQNLSSMSNPYMEKSRPAYMEYASDLLAAKRFRVMSLSERGLLSTLKCECWVNHKIPAELQELARYLGLPLEILKEAYTNNVSSYFENVNGELISPELEKYRKEVTERSLKMKAGGRGGGLSTQKNIRKKQATLEATLEAKLKPLSREERSRDKSIDNVDIQSINYWVEDYESASKGH